MKRLIFSHATHLFIAAGSILMMAEGCSKDGTSPANMPNASFTYTSSRIFPVQVIFTNQSTSSIPGVSTFAWNFGDGSFATTVNATHMYTVPGTYQVSLVQTYGNGTKDTTVQQLQLIVNGPAGTSTTANGTAATSFNFVIVAGYTVGFNNTSTNASSYLWDFGDATTSTSAAATVTHQYNTPGTFKVILKASSNSDSDTCSATLNF